MITVNGAKPNTSMNDRDLLTWLLEHLAGRADRRAEIQGAEWSIGNGQCPVCYGNSPAVNWGPGTRPGHEEGCLFECVIRALHDAPPNFFTASKEIS